MTVELARGQNHPLPQARLEIRVSVERPVIAGATLNDADGRMREESWIAHPAQPQLPGLEVSRQAAAEHRLAVDLDAMPPEVHRVNVLLALPGHSAPAAGPGGSADARGPARFGELAPPSVTVTGLDGAGIAQTTLTGLDTESAVLALELYRRQGAWKVRAVGQGYAGGLSAMLADQGLPRARELAGTIEEAVDAGRARSVAAPAAQAQSAARPPADPYTPVAGDANGWSMEERLYNQVWDMFEDLARTVAAYRSAVDFAESRMEQELDKVLSDPRTRVGPAADAARAEARSRQARLVQQAREVLERDLGQLCAESDVVEPALPPAYARWDNPVWHAYEPPEQFPMAARLGDLALPESAGLRIPMLVRLPLERGLWIDSGRGAPVGSAAGPVAASLMSPEELRRLAADTATAIAARLAAIHPAGRFTLHVVDPAGSAAPALTPLLDSGVLPEVPPAGAAGVNSVLEQLTRRVDLVQMAVRSGAADALPPDVDTAEQLLVVHDFPHGFDDRAVTQLRYLADEGPSVGVHLLMVADREDASAYGPVLSPLWRALLRITPVPDDHLADPWVGHHWTYEPPLVPHGSDVLTQVLSRVASARRTHGAG